MKKKVLTLTVLMFAVFASCFASDASAVSQTAENQDFWTQLLALVPQKFSSILTVIATICLLVDPILEKSTKFKSGSWFTLLVNSIKAISSKITTSKSTNKIDNADLAAKIEDISKVIADIPALIEDVKALKETQTKI